VMTPTLGSDILLEKVASAISNYAKETSVGEVVLVCTNLSERDALELGCKLRKRVPEENFRVEVKNAEKEGSSGDLETAWVAKAFELCQGSCVVLLVGEDPKGVLVKISEELERGAQGLKLAVLAWMPRLDLEMFKKTLEEGDIWSEEVELGVVEL
jgi:hypothetical protein